VPLRFSAGVAELHADESLRQVLERADAALLDAKRQGKAMLGLRGPPARSAQAATANACDRQTLQRAFPAPSMNGKATGSRILGRMSHPIERTSSPHRCLLMAAQPIATRNPPAPPGISQANSRPVRTAARRTAHC
jgi:hypothetical protein